MKMQKDKKRKITNGVQIGLVSSSRIQEEKVSQLSRGKGAPARTGIKSQRENPRMPVKCAGIIKSRF